MIDLPQMCNHSPIPSTLTPTPPPPLYAINYIPSGYLYTFLWSTVSFLLVMLLSISLSMAALIPFPPLCT